MHGCLRRPFLEPTTQRLIDRLAAAGAAPLHTLSPAAARAFLTKVQETPLTKMPASVEDTIPPRRYWRRMHTLLTHDWLQQSPLDEHATPPPKHAAAGWTTGWTTGCATGWTMVTPGDGFDAPHAATTEAAKSVAMPRVQPFFITADFATRVPPGSHAACPSDITEVREARTTGSRAAKPLELLGTLQKPRTLASSTRTIAVPRPVLAGSVGGVTIWSVSP